MGCTEGSWATRHVMTALAIDVPEPRRQGAGIVDGNCVVIVAPGAASETRCAPGATTSGFARPSVAVGPRPEKFGSTSSFVATVPLSSMAPTVMTNGSLAGSEIVDAAGPRFDA